MQSSQKTWAIRGVIAVAAVAGGLSLWHMTRSDDLPDGIVSGNGRIEAVEIDVSAKAPGRIRDILVDEGAFVKAGQVVAHMDSDVLNAQKMEALAQLAQAQNGVQIA